ncbi:hypothetical protein [Salidesulfovibrio onnuriiensis]|uniref:hypothetical protein n=1 Tax=Salidesulfovibrio onnuriiensis TaxID=2583823 RepID=UPI0011CBD76C|nr:hypothetical protein [Salidesulfovibrio onnuriiensis]
MKKKLVEVGNLDPYICLDSKKFYMDDNMILTPGARDELSRRGIAIVCGAKPEAAYASKEEHAHDAACTPAEHGCNGVEDLLVAVAAMVKTEFGVEDPEVLKAISCEAVKTIKENI